MKMKTKTITLHDTDNFGSSLQAYALQRYLLDNNIENEIIDYTPKYLYTHNRPVYIFFRNILFFKDVYSKKKKFKEFKDKYLKVTNTQYYSIKDLMEDRVDADVVICGSDQLWNSNYACGKDPAYYLNFFEGNNIRKVSYAASLGKSEVSDEELDWITDNIRDFSAISVREQSSVSLLEKKLDDTVSVVCDPVLLLEKSVYQDMASKKIVEEPYALIYLIEPGELLDKTITYLKEEKKLKIVVVGSYKNKCYSDISPKDLGPSEFLSLLLYADFVLASSFHAMAFSLLFEKNFAAILPSKNQERINHLLGLMKLENRILNSSKDISLIFEKPEYELISNKFKEYVEYSKEWILSTLNLMK